MGHASAIAHGRAACHQHPQYAIAALAGVLEPKNRCLVPANSFAEYAPEPNPGIKKKDVVWFALNEDRPLFASIDVAMPPIVWSRTALRACRIRIDDALGREARC